ncbi:unnamed protein product, partial [Tenebrio molitor]
EWGRTFRYLLELGDTANVPFRDVRVTVKAIVSDKKDSYQFLVISGQPVSYYK